jgi:hypothetical protein
MNHDPYLELIDQAPGATLSAAQAGDLAAHLEQCSTCRLYQDTAQRTGQLIAAEPQAPANENFVQAVMDGLPAETAEWRFWDLAWAPLAAGGLAAATLMFTPQAPTQTLIASAEDPMVAEVGAEPELEDLLGISLEDR